MNYGYCAKCNKQICYDKVRLCDSCNQLIFKQIKEYLYEHGDTPKRVLSEVFKVPSSLLDYYEEEGMLNPGKNTYEELQEKQKTEEEKKRLLLINELNKAYSKAPVIEPRNEGPKMRFSRK